MSEKKHPLYYIRKSLGLTQAELAELAGLSQVTICRIENNDYEHIREETAIAIADALYMRKRDIFHEFDLSNRGRMPGTTGERTVTVQVVNEATCSKCHLLVPKRPFCSECGAPLESGGEV